MQRNATQFGRALISVALDGNARITYAVIMKQLAIEQLLAEHGQMTAACLSDWLDVQALTTRQLAERLECNHRSLEAWRAGRYAIPNYFWRVLRDLEREKKAKKS